MTKTMDAIEIKVGDIFRWSYRDEKLDRDYLSYWAKSRIAVAIEGGLIRDTYWSGCSDGAMWTHEEAAARLKLEYIGNFSTLDKISEDEATNHTEADIVNLNHGNSPKGNCYRRKGSDRSRAVMIDRVNYELEKAKAAIRSAERDIKRLEETKRTLQSGADLKGIWI